MSNTYARNRLILVFVVGWISYATTYFLRKPLGVIKSDMEKELSFTKSQLGLFDTALLLPYALFQMLLAQIGDLYGARKTFGVCLVFAGISMLTFGAWSSFPVLFALLFLNGGFQSLCWPAANKGLGAWVTDSQRNSVFGYFGTCPFVGGILGTALAVHLQTTIGWRQVHFYPAAFCIVMGIVVLFFYQSPKELNVEVPGKDTAAASKESKSLSMKELWKIPMVPEVAIAIFCLKTVRYTLYMWLPMYLLQQLGYSKASAGMFSTMFEIGGILGSASNGFVLRNHRWTDSSTIGHYWGSTVQTFLSAFALVAFILTSNSGKFINSLMMILAGALNCGPDIILCGSFPTELGEMDGRNAASAIIGFVNGFGSIGTFLEGPIVGFISDTYGWSGMFYSMIFLSFAGALVCYRASRIYDVRQRLKTLNLGNIVVNQSA